MQQHKKANKTKEKEHNKKNTKLLGEVLTEPLASTRGEPLR